MNNNDTIEVSGATKVITDVEFDVLQVAVSIDTGTYDDDGDNDTPEVAKKLELAHFDNSSATKKLSTGYLDSAGNFHAHTSGELFNANDALYGTVTATVSWKDTGFNGSGQITVGGNTYTRADVIEMVNDLTSVAVVASEGSTRARVFAYSSGSGVASSESDGGADVSETISLATLTTSNYSTWTVTWQCYAYIYGGDGAASDANVAAVGTPTVTVTVG